MDQFNIIPGNRTDSLVYHHKTSNYLYKKISEKNDIWYFKCIRKECPGKARCSSGQVFTSTHDHPGDKKQVRKLELLRKLRQRVVSEVTPISEIYTEECNKANCSEEILNYKSLLASLNRLRKKQVEYLNIGEIAFEPITFRSVENANVDDDDDEDDFFECAYTDDKDERKTNSDDDETYEIEVDDDIPDSPLVALEGTICPVCQETFPTSAIEQHVDRCLKNTTGIDLGGIDSAPAKGKKNKRKLGDDWASPISNKKRFTSGKGDDNGWTFMMKSKKKSNYSKNDSSDVDNPAIKDERSADHTTSDKPLAELIRPKTFDEFIGSEVLTGPNSTIRSMVLGGRYNSTIFWGPPGCGKTTISHIIKQNCKNSSNWKFVAMSACMVGVQDVKKAVEEAKTLRAMTGKSTIISMDEIHRFNKSQQDVFLPYVESGIITLIGATTENPSFALNSALLSRCRVVKLEALSPSNVNKLLVRALDRLGGRICKKKTLLESKNPSNCTVISLDEFNIMSNVELEEKSDDGTTWFEITSEAVNWLSGSCAGDARVAINSLQPLVAAVIEAGHDVITLDHVKQALKDNPAMYDRKGDEHYNHASALQKSIRGSDPNAALYWVTRMMNGGEDPLFIARRLVRTAAEDVGLGDPEALKLAVATLEATKNIGMPEADVVLAQCAVYLARAKKNPEVYQAMKRVKSHLKSYMGELPPVPKQICNASTSLMKDMGYGAGYSTDPAVIRNICYLPDEIKNCNFFHSSGDVSD